MANEFVCNNCGYIVEPVKSAKGSMLVELFLWLLFLLPGIIYSVWRLANKELVCPVCKSTNLIPANSPKGQELITNSKSKRYTPVKIPLWKKRWFLVLAGIFMILMIARVTTDNSIPTTAPNTTPEPSFDLTSQKNVAVVFDIPSLIGKDINGVVKQLGNAKGGNPSAQQIQMGVTEWDKTFTKNGRDLLVTFTISNQKIVDFFLDTDDPSGQTKDKARLLKQGNLLENSPSYSIVFVPTIKDRTYFTGVKVVPR